MAKRQLAFDPEKMEFHFHERGPSWDESDLSVAEEARPGSPRPESSAEDEDTHVDGQPVIKPEGYVDPTPTRRRRRRRRSSSRSSSRESGSAWRGVTWGVILIMGVLWVYMLYTQNKKKSSAPGDSSEELFLFNRNDVLGGE